MPDKEIEMKINKILSLVSLIPHIKDRLEAIEKDISEVAQTLSSLKEEIC